MVKGEGVKRAKVERGWKREVLAFIWIVKRGKKKHCLGLGGEFLEKKNTKVRGCR